MLAFYQYFLLFTLFFGVLAAEVLAQDSNKPDAPSREIPLESKSVSGRKELKLLEPTFAVQDEPKIPLTETKAPASFQDRQVKLLGGVEEQNLIIEWDDWHNRFAKAVAARMFNNYIDAINMPHLAATWYHCEVTSDKHVKNIRISKSSGNFWYDKAVIQAVMKLDGNDILAFPGNSQRNEISTDLGIVLGGEKKGYLKFGDLEFHQFSKENPAVPKAVAPPTALEDAASAQHSKKSKKHDTVPD